MFWYRYSMYVAAGTPLALGVAVRQARQDKGMTQEALAKLAHVSRPFVSNLERGQNPRAELERVLSVLRALGLAVTVTASPPEDRSFEAALKHVLS